jgi:hypothetical protein
VAAGAAEDGADAGHWVHRVISLGAGRRSRRLRPAAAAQAAP